MWRDKEYKLTGRSDVQFYNDGDYHFNAVMSDNNTPTGLGTKTIKVFPELVRGGRVIKLTIYKHTVSPNTIVFEYIDGTLHEHNIRDFVLNDIVQLCCHTPLSTDDEFYQQYEQDNEDN
jgi:hypothetical protein